MIHKYLLICQIALLAFIFCKNEPYEKLHLSTEYAGFKSRHIKELRFYKNKELTEPYDKEVQLPHVGSTPISERYRSKNRGEVILEVKVGANILYVNERDIYYDFSKCAKFNDLNIRTLAELRNIEYAGNFSNQVGSSGGLFLRDADEEREAYGHSVFVLKIRGEEFNIHTFEIMTAYCEGRFAVHRVLDYLAFKIEPGEKNPYLEVCMSPNKEQHHSYLFEMSEDSGENEFFGVKRAWFFNRVSQRIESSKIRDLKCINECAGGC